MKTAIALFGDEVSPRFGCARRFLVVDQTDDRTTERTTIDTEAVVPGRLPALLASLDVTHVICGGIHRRFLTDLSARGIRVTWGVIGPAEDALEAWHENRLQPNQVVVTDRCRRRRERSCRRPAPMQGDDPPGSERNSP